jgi:hypothetical protein
VVEIFYQLNWSVKIFIITVLISILIAYLSPLFIKDRDLTEEEQKEFREKRFAEMWDEYPKCINCYSIRKLEGCYCCGRSRAGGYSGTMGFDMASGYDYHVTYLREIKDLNKCPDGKWIKPISNVI